MRTHIRWLWVISLSVALGACDQENAQWNNKSVAGLLPNLRFELIDEDGERVTAKRFQGKLVMLFFGFTHCPEVCPMTLTKLSRVIADLPPEHKDSVRVLFVSVDPERDPPRRLKEYTDNFGPHFVGATGDQQALQAISERYRVTYGYGEPDAQGNYEVSHSSAVYVFDRNGEARLLVRTDNSAADIADDLRTLLEGTSRVMAPNVENN